MNRGRRRWAVFISGRGSNLAALLEMRDTIDIALVVSSTGKAHGLLRARRAGVPTLILPKPIRWDEIDPALQARGVSDIFLAGFMRVLPAAFVARWHGRILNLHPSLLPLYPGLDSIRRAYEDDADVGASVHVVTEGVDEGQVILQRDSLKRPRARGYSLERSEFTVHVDEQRLIREAVLKWNP